MRKTVKTVGISAGDSELDSSEQESQERQNAQML